MMPASFADAQCPDIVVADCGPTCTDVESYLNTNYNSCGPFIIHKIIWDCKHGKGYVILSSATYANMKFYVWRTRSGGIFISGDPCC